MMKRKIKRKLFLMGMMVAAGIPSGVLAKGPARTGVDARESFPTFPSDEVDPSRSVSPFDPLEPPRPSRLSTAVKEMFGNPDTEAELRHNYVQPPAWRLELLPCDPAAVQYDHPKIAGDAQLGFALRLRY